MNDLFPVDLNLSQLLHQHWDLDDFLDNVFNVFVDFDDLRYYFFDLNDFMNVDSLFNYFLDLIHFGNLSHPVNDFFHNLFDLFDLLYNSFNRNNLFPKFFYFYNSVLKVRNNPFHLLDSFLNNNIIHLLFNLNDLDLLLFYRNYSIPKLVNLLNFPMHNFNRHNFFNKSVNRHLNLNWNDYVSIYLNYFWLLNYIGDDLLHFQCPRNLNVLNNHSLCNHLLEFCCFLVDFISDKHFPYNIYWLLHSQVNISWSLNLYDPFLNYGNVHDFLYLNYLRNCNNLLYDLLDDLRHFYYFLDHSWNNHYFLYYFLHLNNFRNLNQFLNYFLNHCWNSLHPFYNFFHRYDPIFNDSDDLRLFHKMIDNPFYLFHTILIQYFRFFNLHFFMNNPLNNLYNRLLNVLLFHLDNLFNQWHLNNFLNDFFHHPILNNWFLDYSFNRLDSITINYLLNHNLHLNWLFNYIMNLNYFLYDLRNLNDLLNSLNDRYYFLNVSIHRLVSDFNMIAYVRCRDVLHSLDDLLYYFLNLNNLRHLHSHLNNLLYYLIHWNRLLYNLSSWHNLFPHQVNVPIFSYRHNDLFLDLDVFFYLDWFLDDFLHFNNSWYLLNYFDDLLYDFGNLDYSFLYAWYLNKLFYN